MSGLYPLVSNRTIITYDRREVGSTQLGPTIRDRRRSRQLVRVLPRRLQGAIVGKETRNGAPFIWVSFEPGRCQDASCALGFVRTDDGKYRLATLPPRDGFEPPKVYRGIVAKRQRMKPGRLKALSDSNPVYGLQRKRKRKHHRTVFLELRKDIDRRTKKDPDPFGGRQGAPVGPAQPQPPPPQPSADPR